MIADKDFIESMERMIKTKQEQMNDLPESAIGIRDRYLDQISLLYEVKANIWLCRSGRIPTQDEIIEADKWLEEQITKGVIKL